MSLSLTQVPSSLVSIDWLAEHLESENLVILDASVVPIAPFTTTTLPENLAAPHLPGALRFDYDTQVCDQNASLPHMMPSAEYFEEQVCKLGINNDSMVVIYDDTGVYASPRAWWMFKAMGHNNVAVLDGGSPAWHAAGLAMSDTLLAEAETKGTFKAEEQKELFCDGMMVYQLLNNPACTIADARSAGRFYGRDPEPRENLQGGHMPGAINIPFQLVLDDIHMKSIDELKELFDSKADPNHLLLTTCGSGLSACILTLAADLAGYENQTVYDGSWCEWGQSTKLPVTTED